MENAGSRTVDGVDEESMKLAYHRAILAETPTIVLVHGGWHGSWCWEPLLPFLTERGIEARTVDLPSCGCDTGSLGDLRDDVEAVRAAVAKVDGPVVLCGHSWGGVVITEAGAVGPVRRLVYLCAYVPDAGQSVATLREGRSPRPWILARDGALELDRGAAADVLYHDCDPATAAWAAERLVPQNAACLRNEVSAAAWRHLPSTYVLTTLDRVIPGGLQRRLADRCGEVVEIGTGHSPFLARPERVAGILAGLA